MDLSSSRLWICATASDGSEEGRGEGEGVKGRRGNTWSGRVAGEPHQWRSAGSASSSKEWHPGVEHEAEAGGGLDGEPAAADEGAVLAVAGAEHAEDECEELLGEAGDAVLSADSLDDRGEELRCHRDDGRRRGRGLAAAQMWWGTGP